MKTRVDDLGLLEDRLEGLLDYLGDALKSNEELRKRNGALEMQAGELKALRDQNHKLLSQIEKLQKEIHSIGDREGQIRDRLQGILKKIDTMEEVLAGQAAAE